MSRRLVTLLLALAILTGCGAAGTSIPSSASSSVARSTGRSSASPAAGGSAVADASPEASASALAGGSVADRMVALLQSDTFVGHVDQVTTGTSVAESTTDEARLTITLDVNGPDLSGHLGGTTAGKTIDTDIVIVGTTAYVRTDRGAWKTAPRAAAASSVVSLITGLTVVSSASQLKDLGIETIDGRSLHHLTAASTIPYTTTSGTVGHYETFEFYVEEDGTPVRFESSFAGTQGTVTISGTTEVRYSKIGGPITIVPPADVPSAKS